MDPWFRYFSSANARAFAYHGEVLFRSLSYYRDYEDSGVRGDELEGTLQHRPNTGLIANLKATGDGVELPCTFESSANEVEIFVYCFSTKLSDDLARRFSADVCVEITNPPAFLAKISKALKLRARFRRSPIVHGPIKYYVPDDPPLGDWAVPERIALRKPQPFVWQCEYRLAIPKGDAFRAYNVVPKLVPLGAPRPPRSLAHPELRFKLGSLLSITRTHTL